jgi:hypothetical protein
MRSIHVTEYPKVLEHSKPLGHLVKNLSRLVHSVSIWTLLLNGTGYPNHLVHTLYKAGLVSQQSPIVMDSRSSKRLRKDSTVEKGSSMELNTVLSTEMIDRDGDVLVHSGNRKLLVSSKVLGLASPVFYTMLNSDFREGNSGRSSQHPLKLPLPDDDPDALAGLFHAWHFSALGDQLHQSIDRQLEIVILADKYNCALSIQALGKCWLLIARSEIYKAPELWQLCTIAFLLNLADEFSIFTASLIKLLSAEDLETVELHEMLPYTVRGTSISYYIISMYTYKLTL